ncbi:hypothetical protein AQ768_22190 [Burkholderia pseudomallei]|nr:hypothetical protein AQ768_22190 [Burkholderia pseudomallei]
MDVLGDVRCIIEKMTKLLHVGLILIHTSSSEEFVLALVDDAMGRKEASAYPDDEHVSSGCDGNCAKAKLADAGLEAAPGDLFQTHYFFVSIDLKGQ